MAISDKKLRRQIARHNRIANRHGYANVQLNTRRLIAKYNRWVERANRETIRLNKAYSREHNGV